jgi:hypothetical protein
MSLWVYEFISLWVYKFIMSLWVYEFMSLWVYEFISLWVYELWVYEFMSLWVCEYTSLSVHHYNHYTYLQNWNWEITGILWFQIPIWRFDFTMEKWCFRFSAKFWASQWLAISFDSSKSPRGNIFWRAKKGAKTVRKTDEKNTHPLPKQKLTPVLQIVKSVFHFIGLLI